MASGVSPNVWADQEWRVIMTAADLLSQGSQRDPEGRQMSG